MGSKSIKLVYTLEIMKMIQRIVLVVVGVTIEGLVEVDRAVAVVDDAKQVWVGL